MPLGIDIEAMREIFKDQRSWISVGVVKKLLLASDRSELRVKVEILDEDARIIIAIVSWPSVGPDAGFITFPNVGDLALLVCPYGEDDLCTVMKFYSSKEDTIPEAAIDGDPTWKAVAGKKINVLSDTRINLADVVAAATEAVIRGKVFQTMMSTLMTDIASITVLGNLGAVTTTPINSAAFTAHKTSPIDDDKMLSDTVFVDKDD